MAAAKHLFTYDNPAPEEHLNLMAEVLAGHGVMIIPTDVSWAFVVDATSTPAMEKLWRLKPAHPRDRPFSILCADISMVSRVAKVESHVYRYLKKCLPGPYTILLERHATLAKQIRDARRVVGVRVPDLPLVSQLLKTYGKPLVTSTVPHDGEDQHELLWGFQVFERYGAAIDLLVDLGTEVLGLDTTIVDFTGGRPTLVREGTGSLEPFGGDLEEIDEQKPAYLDP